MRWWRPRRVLPPAAIVCVDDHVPRASYSMEDLGNTTRLPRSVFCPITQMPMLDPLLAADGHSYERAALVKWLAKKKTSPVTGAPLQHMVLTPNHALRNTITELVRPEGARDSDNE